jgi:multimeric flavodoxin WrbA
MGSPRRRDGYAVIQQIQAILAQHAEVELDMINCKDAEVEECRGCDLCLQKGEQYCPIKDGLADIVRRLEQADALVFASPVYAMQVTASFKRMVDRLAWLFHRPSLVGKPALTLVTTGGGGIRPTARYLEMTAVGWGCRVVGHIELISSFYFDRPGPNYFYDQSYQVATDRAIAKQAGRLARALMPGGLPAPGYFDLYMFQGLRSKTFTSEADRVYWEAKGWMNSDYYYPVSLSPGKHLFSRILNVLIKLLFASFQKKQSA